MQRGYMNYYLRLFIFCAPVFLIASLLGAQTITNITPEGEVGASFKQTITVVWGVTPSPASDTTVVIFGAPKITWKRISESSIGIRSYHDGRMTVPNDIGPGIYQLRMYNSGFYPGPYVDSTIRIFDFSVQVTASTQSVLNAGSSNVPVTLTFSPGISGWSKYSILSVTPTLSGVTYVAGSGAFISSTQLSLSLNVSESLTSGSLGLYIQYGYGYYAGKEGEPLAGNQPHSIRIFPKTSSDFCTVYLNPNSSIITIAEANPTITSITPSIVSLGDRNVQLIINGARFAPGVTLTTAHSGVSFSNTQYILDTQLTSYVTVSANAQLGWVAITVTNPDGKYSISNQALRVVSKKPVFRSASTNVLIIGRTGQRVCITGENFYNGTSVIFYSDAVHVRQTQLINSNTLCIVVDVDSGAQVGPVSIIISNPDGAYTTVENAFYLSLTEYLDKTILLLYPGVLGGSPQMVNERDLTPSEIIDTQYPMFRWYSQAEKFKISIYKPLAGQTSFQEVINNRPFYETELIGLNYFQYPLQARPIEPGIRYYWKVSAYFNTLPQEFITNTVAAGNDDQGFQGEIKESEVWSFILRETRIDQRRDIRFGTLNPVYSIAIEPSYVEVTAGDRVVLELRGYDSNQHLAALIPDYSLLDFANVEKNYPDIKLLPKSFGRTELVVPNIKGNTDFQTRLMRNPAEFSRFPIILSISQKAKGVAAVLATWQNMKFYAFVNILPPKHSILLNGDIDGFRIGTAERLSETFEVVLEKPQKEGAVLDGKGRLFIDSAGFREIGYLPVTITDVRLDTSGRAYTGEVVFSGSHIVNLAGYAVKIEKLKITPLVPASVNGKLLIQPDKTIYEVEFDGKLSAIGDIAGQGKLSSTIKLPKAEIPEKSIVEIDFHCSWSPEYKKYDPSFRGLIVSVSKGGEILRKAAVARPEDLLSIEPEAAVSRAAKAVKIERAISSGEPDTSTSVYLTTLRGNDGKVNLNWILKGPEMKTFNIYRRSDEESQYRLIAERVAQNRYTDSFVSPDRAYWYKVVPVDAQTTERKASKPVKIE